MSGDPQGARRRQMRERFQRLYGREPDGWVRAPGRAELLGTDTDDHLGYVMTMAIHLDTWIAFAPSGSERVRIHSMNLGAAPSAKPSAVSPAPSAAPSAEYRLGREPREVKAAWDRYVNGVSQVLAERGYTLQGVDAVIHSTVPIGGGLSSSASLEVAAALMFQAAGGFTLEPKLLAQVCQQAENECVGVGCGILDQYSSAFGRRGVALLLDCRSLTHVEVRIPADIRVVICDTNFPRTLAGSEYAKRRQECDEGTRILRGLDPQILTLRDVSAPAFERLSGSLPELYRRRCRFVVEENHRVVDFMAAVVKDDRPAMRRACAASFAGLRDLYGKSVPAMERMFEAMMEAPGTIAARQSGGGFGGCLIAYVEAGRVEEFAAHVRRAYPEKTGLTPAVYVTEPSAGAGPLEG